MIIVAVLIVILAIAGYFVYSQFFVQETAAIGVTEAEISEVKTSLEALEGQEPDFDNILALKDNIVIQSLPNNALISLKFYNFAEGERIWEKQYALRKASVTEETVENEDIELNMHSRYSNVLTPSNFCSVIEVAKDNGELWAESELSTTSLLWKYKSIAKYRSCFGI